MSRKIAPGRWDPWMRIAAKSWAKVAGALMVAFGLVTGFSLAQKLVEADGVSTFQLVLVGGVSVLPTVVGALALFPDILTPLAYRALDELDRRKQGAPDEEA